MILSRSYQYNCPECGAPYLTRPAFFSLKQAPDYYSCNKCRAIIPITSERYDYYVYYSRKLCVTGTFLYFTICGFLSDSPVDWWDILFMTLAIGVLGGHFAAYILSFPVGVTVELISRSFFSGKVREEFLEGSANSASNKRHATRDSSNETGSKGKWAAAAGLFRYETRRWPDFLAKLRKYGKRLKGITAGIILYFFLHLTVLSVCGLLAGFYIGSHDLSDDMEVKSIASSLPVMIRIFDILGAVAAGFLCSLIVREEELLSSAAMAVIVVILNMAASFLLDPAGFSLLSHWSGVIIFGAIVFGGFIRYRTKNLTR